ncbi:hypothetical protein EON65_34980 [archaeon]|nr:MAG: hypothetical protein EON65_34980 [archaeon]
MFRNGEHMLPCVSHFMTYVLFSTQPYLDPNILKHLNVDKQSEYYKNLAQNLEDEDSRAKEGRKLTALDFASLEKKNPAVIEIDHRPKPSFEEKKKMRETMFLMLEESSIEETRLVSA